MDGMGMEWDGSVYFFTLLHTINDAALKLLHPTTPNKQLTFSGFSGEAEAKWSKNTGHRWLF